MRLLLCRNERQGVTDCYNYPATSSSFMNQTRSSASPWSPPSLNAIRSPPSVRSNNAYRFYREDYPISHLCSNFQAILIPPAITYPCINIRASLVCSNGWDGWARSRHIPDSKHSSFIAHFSFGEDNALGGSSSGTAVPGRSVVDIDSGGETETGEWTWKRTRICRACYVREKMK